MNFFEIWNQFRFVSIIIKVIIIKDEDSNFKVRNKVK